jgi:hypothetical protein
MIVSVLRLDDAGAGAAAAADDVDDCTGDAKSLPPSFEEDEEDDEKIVDVRDVECTFLVVSILRRRHYMPCDGLVGGPSTSDALERSSSSPGWKPWLEIVFFCCCLYF